MAGRGRLPDPGHRGGRMGQEGQPPEGEVVPRKAEGVVQRLRDTGQRGVVRSRAGRLQLRDHGELAEVLPLGQARPFGEALCDRDGQRLVAQEGVPRHMGGEGSGVRRHKARRNRREAAALFAGPQSDRAGLEDHQAGEHPQQVLPVAGGAEGEDRIRIRRVVPAERSAQEAVRRKIKLIMAFTIKLR